MALIERSCKECGAAFKTRGQYDICFTCRRVVTIELRERHKKQKKSRAK